MKRMDKSPFLPAELGPEDLAHACEERAQSLQARAWRDEAERDALREATADLLNAAARQLAALSPMPVNAPGLSTAELRETLATRVVHQPLHHPPLAAFEPGSGAGG